MSSQRQKEIESLRAKLASLEEAEKRDAQVRDAITQAYEQLTGSLEASHISLEEFVRFYARDFTKITNKITREKGRSAVSGPSKRVAKKQSARKSTRKRRGKTTITVKIPAGSYTNVPAEPEKVFVVKEKGPRPKVLKAYAEEIGLEAFMSNCLVR